jgi:hypothetical protein
VGRTEVEDAVLRLDTLTKEESLTMVARNLEVMHLLKGNVEATKMLSEQTDDDVKATKALTEDISGHVRSIDYNVKMARDGMQHLCPPSEITDPPLCAKIVTDEVKRLSSP